MSLELNVYRQLEADSLTLLSGLPALRNLVFDGVKVPSSLSAVTQCQSLVVSDCSPFAPVEAALRHVSGLTTLFLNALHMSVIPPLGHLLRLERLLIETAPDDDLALPPGPWLRSIRWLGLPWPVLEAGVGVLRGAPRLEYLFSAGTPGAGVAQGRWHEFREFVATHPPLRCLAYAPFDIDDEECDPPPQDMLRLHLVLRYRRPELQLRLFDHTWHLTDHSFFHELMSCQDIPPGPGSFAG